MVRFQWSWVRNQLAADYIILSLLLQLPNVVECGKAAGKSNVNFLAYGEIILWFVYKNVPGNKIVLGKYQNHRSVFW